MTKETKEQIHERLFTTDPMPKSDYGLKTAPKSMTGAMRSQARTETIKGTAEYLASGKTVTKVKTVGTPAWLAKRQKAQVIVKTKDLLKGSSHE